MIGCGKRLMGEKQLRKLTNSRCNGKLLFISDRA